MDWDRSACQHPECSCHEPVKDWLHYGVYDCRRCGCKPVLKEYVVLSAIGEIGNESVTDNWFDTQAEAEAWVKLISVERPAYYEIRHRSILYESY
jgi:hypothetical protein